MAVSHQPLWRVFLRVEGIYLLDTSQCLDLRRQFGGGFPMQFDMSYALDSFELDQT